jgi:hypothetical protein
MASAMLCNFHFRSARALHAHPPISARRIAGRSVMRKCAKFLRPRLYQRKFFSSHELFPLEFISTIEGFCGVYWKIWHSDNTFPLFRHRNLLLRDCLYLVPTQLRLDCRVQRRLSLKYSSSLESLNTGKISPLNQKCQAAGFTTPPSPSSTLAISQSTPVHHIQADLLQP